MINDGTMSVKLSFIRRVCRELHFNMCPQVVINTSLVLIKKKLRDAFNFVVELGLNILNPINKYVEF